MIPTETTKERAPLVQRIAARAKQHPVVATVIVVVTVAAFVWKAVDVIDRTADWVSDVRQPHKAEYAALAELDLDTRVAFLEDRLGTAKKVVDLCDVKVACPADGEPPIVMYLHETKDVTVRSVFEGDSLALYTVTLRSSELAPPITWLDYDLGNLGDVTFAEAVKQPEVTPTDAWLFLGPQSVAYAEVFAVGAPGDYRGLLLASAPDGYLSDDMAFDLDAAHVMAASDGAPFDAPAWSQFRAVSTPNTWGEFRDDGGSVSLVVRDAERASEMLFVQAE